MNSTKKVENGKSTPQVPKIWNCGVCKQRNRSQYDYCCRCGHFQNVYKRHWQYEELSDLYQGFFLNSLSFDQLKSEIKELRKKGNSRLTDILDDFIMNENSIKAEEIEIYDYVLNSLQGSFSMESLIYLEDQSYFDLSNGIIYENDGLGTFKGTIKTIDHITYILEHSFDSYSTGLQVAFPDDVDFFQAVKTFLEHYRINLKDVWIPEKFAKDKWPFPIYELWREDDNANRYLMDEFYIKNAAQKKCDEFLARAHKQDYWIKEAEHSIGSPIRCLNMEAG